MAVFRRGSVSVPRRRCTTRLLLTSRPCPRPPPTPAQHTLEQEPERRPFWEIVPDELLHRIASKLDDGTALARLRRVSTRCRRIVDGGEDLWRDLCVARFNVSPHADPPSWAEVYRWAAGAERERRLIVIVRVAAAGRGRRSPQKW
jgi:hypothetical protein